MHYYQRWAENDSSKHAARKEAQNAALVQLLELSEATATPTSQLKFICDAWDQVGSQIARVGMAWTSDAAGFI